MIHMARHMRPYAMRISTATSSWTRSPWHIAQRFRYRFRAQRDSSEPRFGQQSIRQPPTRVQETTPHNGADVTRTEWIRDSRPSWEKDAEVEEDDDLEDWQETLKCELNERGIELPSYQPGTYRILCPKCDGGSTSEISCSVTIEDEEKVTCLEKTKCEMQHAIYNCFRAKCDWSGRVVSSRSGALRLKSVTDENTRVEKPDPHFQPLDSECLQFFKERGISEEVLQRNGIQMEIKGRGEKFIAFPYTVDGEIVNVKYRNVHKKEFHQVSRALKVFYGLDDIKGQEEIIIVEGEMDKLALEMAGFKNVLSVPNGAPGKVQDGSISTNNKMFNYLENSFSNFGGIKKFVLATDNDEPGLALAEELARRFGAWKCWRVKWPKDLDSTIPSDKTSIQDYTEDERQDDARWYRKDANEVLQKDSIEMLGAYIQKAEPYPVHGLHKFADFLDEIERHYHRQKLCPSGFSTGWPGLDPYYRVVPGELTVVSGVPNSGKSEWLDALAVQLAELYGWNISFASMEKQVEDHARQLIEKHIGKPFYSNVHYSEGVSRMEADEARKGLWWINEQFSVIRDFSDVLPTVEWILKVRGSVTRYGIRGLVIDPYNELDHARSKNMSETEFVNTILTMIKSFARTYQVHVWLVAHPRQLHDWRGEPPNLYDISGSAHFVNKADAGLVVHRNWQKIEENTRGKTETKVLSDDEQKFVRIIVRKMRNKVAGRVGEYTLKYNLVDGTYSDPSEERPRETRPAQAAKTEIVIPATAPDAAVKLQGKPIKY